MENSWISGFFTASERMNPQRGPSPVQWRVKRLNIRVFHRETGRCAAGWYLKNQYYRNNAPAERNIGDILSCPVPDDPASQVFDEREYLCHIGSGISFTS